MIVEFIGMLEQPAFDKFYILVNVEPQSRHFIKCVKVHGGVALRVAHYLLRTNLNVLLALLHLLQLNVLLVHA